MYELGYGLLSTDQPHILKNVMIPNRFEYGLDKIRESTYLETNTPGRDLSIGRLIQITGLSSNQKKRKGESALFGV